eukprot:894330-Rhodomonas_salina.3
MYPGTKGTLITGVARAESGGSRFSSTAGLRSRAMDSMELKARADANAELIEPNRTDAESAGETTIPNHQVTDSQGKKSYRQRFLEVQAACYDIQAEVYQNMQIERETLDDHQKEAQRLVQQASTKVLCHTAAAELRSLREQRGNVWRSKENVQDAAPQIQQTDYMRGAESLLAHMEYLKKAKENSDLERYGLTVLQQAEASRKQGQLQRAFEMLWNQLEKLEQIGSEVQDKDASVIFLLERQREFYSELVRISIEMGKMEQAHAILCLAKGKALNKRSSKATGTGGPASGFHATPFANGAQEPDAIFF